MKEALYGCIEVTGISKVQKTSHYILCIKNT